MLDRDPTGEEIAEAIKAAHESLQGLWDVFSDRRVRPCWLLIDQRHYVPAIDEDGAVTFLLDIDHQKQRAWLYDALGLMDELADIDMDELEQR